MAKPRNVAVVFPVSHPFFSHLLRGIVDYLGHQAKWQLARHPDWFAAPASIRDLKGWHGDGAIAMVNSPGEARYARSLGVPVVNLSGLMRDPGLPRARCDYQAAGRLAAEHLLQRGFTRFGYYGMKRFWWAKMVGSGFRQRLEEQGRQSAVFEATCKIGVRYPLQQESESLQRWLGKLEPPVGVMASYVPRAVMVAEACQQIGLRIPQDVALIAFGSEELTCELCTPPLTGVAIDPQRIGWEAAALLDRLMAGRKPKALEVVVPPLGVTERASTDVLAVEDPLIVAAVAYIRRNAADRIGVEDVVKALGVSRRWLEQRFRDCLGCTPHDQICKERVDRVKQRLRERADATLQRTALASGFNDANCMRIVFARLTGITPAEYRKSLRANPPPRCAFAALRGD